MEFILSLVRTFNGIEWADQAIVRPFRNNSNFLPFRGGAIAYFKGKSTGAGEGYLIFNKVWASFLADSRCKACSFLVESILIK